MEAGSKMALLLFINQLDCFRTLGFLGIKTQFAGIDGDGEFHQ